jgi:carbon monoxide dehydrogenase subunit G
MRIEQRIRIEAPIDRVWAFLTDLPAVSRCVPDVEAVAPVDADTVSGTIRVKVGPIGLRLAGRVRMSERDAASHRAVLEVEANDRRIGGGVAARTTFQLEADEGASTTLAFATEATLLGRLGQFGQPIIRRKSDEMARQFAANVAAALRAGT